MPDRSALTSAAGRLALVTGATGYIGGLLVPRLLEAGYRVRVLSRSAAKLSTKDWRERVEIVEGNAEQHECLRRALADVDVAYFMLHSMDGKGDFVERDRALATSFGRAAKEAGVDRIVYLGGLHPDEDQLSDHLASRVEVGQILIDSGVPTAALQAGIVLGSGSASFEMFRHLTERLPVMTAPKWVLNRIQPIAVDDVLHYLVGAAALPPSINRTFDVAGPEVLTYRDMMQRFATITGLRRRLIVAVPVLTPELASYWVGLVTPVPSGVARPLVDSLVHECVRQEDDVDDLVGPPPGGPTGFDEAVRRAMADGAPQRGPQTLAAVAAAVVASAAVGTLAGQPDGDWYRRLRTPAWQPPPLAFPVAWTALFASIAGVSTSVIRTLEDDGRTHEATAFKRALGANLVLNAAWTVVFWRLRRLRLATAVARAPAVAGALAASSTDLTRRAGAAGPVHSRFLAPYAVWTSFATALTAKIARLNPQG